jgi:hypothetical protein
VGCDCDAGCVVGERCLIFKGCGEVLKGSLRGIGDLNKSFDDGVYDILCHEWLRRPKRRGKITRVSIPGATDVHMLACMCYIQFVHIRLTLLIRQQCSNSIQIHPSHSIHPLHPFATLGM